MTDDFAPELFLTRPTIGNRQTKIVQKLNMRESVQKVIEEKRSESILRGNSSSISMKRASSRVSKLSFGGDEIRTYEKVSFLSVVNGQVSDVVPDVLSRVVPGEVQGAVPGAVPGELPGGSIG